MREPAESEYWPAVQFNVPMPSQSSGSKNKSSNDSRAEYIIPTIEIFDQYFEAKGHKDTERLKQLKEKYDFHNLGFEVKLADQQKQQQIESLLSKIELMEQSITEEEQQIIKLKQEKLQMKAQCDILRQLREAKNKALQEVQVQTGEVIKQLSDMRQSNVHEVVSKNIMAESMDKQREIQELKGILQKQKSKEENEIEKLAQKLDKLHQEISDLKNKNNSIRLPESPEIKHLNEDINKYQRDLEKLRKQCKKYQSV